MFAGGVMPSSILGKLHGALENHLLVDVEVKKQSGRKVAVGDRFEAAVTIMNPSRQEGWPVILYKDLEYSVEGTEFAAPTRVDSDWHCLACELAPGESITKTVELKAIRIQPLGHERFVKVRVRGRVDPEALLRVSFSCEPPSHFRPEVGEDWPESMRRVALT